MPNPIVTSLVTQLSMFVQRVAKTLVCENLAKAPSLAMAVGKGGSAGGPLRCVRSIRIDSCDQRFRIRACVYGSLHLRLGQCRKIFVFRPARNSTTP